MLVHVQIPNFAMDTCDVEPGAEGQRFTAHIFDTAMAFTFAYGFRSGQAIRTPADMSEWPPAVLFDAVYASAVMRNFGVLDPALLDEWVHEFYPAGPTTSAHTDLQRQDVVASENSNQQVGDELCDGGRTPDVFDLLFFLPYIRMQPEDVMRYLNECREAAAAKEREELEAKVNSWRQHIPGEI